jgi:NhaP-type Na+/H+ or K+/H+ antiporter
MWLFPALGVWLALLVGAALAPTDAALGVSVVTNKTVPSRVRRLITVESGLNDGIATPIVMLSIAEAAAAVSGGSESSGLGGALVELLVGVAVGVAVGFAGGWLLRWARRRGWAAEDFIGVAVLALALLAYLASLAVSGNGFVAAFCGGIASVPQRASAIPPNSPSSSRRGGRSRCSCGWRSARSPRRSSSTA